MVGFRFRRKTGSPQNEPCEVLKGKRNNHGAFIFCERKINSGGNCDVAKCEVKMPEEIYKAIEKLNKNREEILTSTLKAGGEVVLNAVRNNLNRAIRNSSNRSTGELKNSLGLSPVKLSSRGVYNVKVGFSEPRHKQYAAKKKRSYYVITNALIANVIEYGKKGQPPRPFMRPAKVSSEKAAISAMKAKFDEEVKKRCVK